MVLSGKGVAFLAGHAGLEQAGLEGQSHSTAAAFDCPAVCVSFAKGNGLSLSASASSGKEGIGELD